MILKIPARLPGRFLCDYFDLPFTTVHLTNHKEKLKKLLAWTLSCADWFYFALPFQIEECLVCSEKPARALFKPCGHMVACESKFWNMLIIPNNCSQILYDKSPYRSRYIALNATFEFDGMSRQSLVSVMSWYCDEKWANIRRARYLSH